MTPLVRSIRSRRLSLLSLLLTGPLLGACGNHHYVAIPHANAVDSVTKLIGNRATGSPQSPTITVVAGSPSLVVGQSVTLHVDLTSLSGLNAQQLLLFMLNQEGLSYGYWSVDLSPEELASGGADLDMFALADGPTTAWCKRDNRGLGTCYQEADEGMTGLRIVPANDITSGWPGSTVAVTSAPTDTSSGGGACTFTFADCCAGAPGIKATSCALKQSYFDQCGCPSGTTVQGAHGDGTTWCTCPQ